MAVINGITRGIINGLGLMFSYANTTLLNITGSSGQISGTPQISNGRTANATWIDASNVLHTSAAGIQRYSYVASLGKMGMLIEPADTNVLVVPNDLTNAAWGAYNATVTAESTIKAPDGTSNCSKIVMQSTPTSGTFSIVIQSAIARYASVWLRGAVGGETLYLSETPDAVNYIKSTLVTLTTSWQRVTLDCGASGALRFIVIGTDRRDSTQVSTPAQTVYSAFANFTPGSIGSTITVQGSRDADSSSVPYTGNWSDTAGTLMFRFNRGLPPAGNSTWISATGRTILSVSGSTLSAFDGTNTATVNIGSASQNDTYISLSYGALLQIDGNGNIVFDPVTGYPVVAVMMFLGFSEGGSSWTFGTAVPYDGSFDGSTQLNLFPSVQTPINLIQIETWSDIKSPAWITSNAISQMAG